MSFITALTLQEISQLESSLLMLIHKKSNAFTSNVISKDFVNIGSICYKIYFDSLSKSFVFGKTGNKCLYLAWCGSLEECRLWLEISKTIWKTRGSQS